MKWTTSNLRNSNYIKNHEIYVGTLTGSFKKLVPSNEDNPFMQTNLQNINSLTKESRITALAFKNEEKSEIIIGRHNMVEIQSLNTEQLENKIEMTGGPVVGVACFERNMVAGFGNGTIQCISLDSENNNKELFSISSGDDMSHLRQCNQKRNFIATGGKGRKNNLKVFDIEASGKQIFSSKNLPNDFLQLEVPVWDSDIGFIDSPHLLATCSRHGYVRVYDTRKQRRPVQCYSNEDQMSFSTLVANGNCIFTGTTMGALKAFDIRRMKNSVHTYKGFTGSISDLNLDDSGKYLVSSSYDRYVRVHHVDSCVMMYQCYVKSKASRILIREYKEDPKCLTLDEQQNTNGIQKNSKKNKGQMKEDKEYDDLFDNMQTICENFEEHDNQMEEVEQTQELNDEEDDDNKESTLKTKMKRKMSLSKTKLKKKRT